MIPKNDNLIIAGSINSNSNISSCLPKFSIVTPSFNQDQYLEDTLLSVLNQDYPNLEYVVIDGGSNDSSVDIIQRYSSRLSYWQSKRDKGHGDALNQGFSRTSGEIMSWLNSDDMYFPWTLRTVAEIFSSFPEVNWIVGLNAWWNDKGVVTDARRCPKNIHDFLLGDFGWIQQESVFWRRSLWEKAGGHINEKYKLMVDGELWTRFFLNDDLYIVDCLLGGYRMHDTNRAKLNYQECLREMEASIDVMRGACSQATLDKYKALKGLMKLRKSILMRIPIIGPIAKTNVSRQFMSYDYPRIYYSDGNWVKGKLPFRS